MNPKLRLSVAAILCLPVVISGAELEDLAVEAVAWRNYWQSQRESLPAGTETQVKVLERSDGVTIMLAPALGSVIEVGRQQNGDRFLLGVYPTPYGDDEAALERRYLPKNDPDCIEVGRPPEATSQVRPAVAPQLPMKRACAPGVIRAYSLRLRFENGNVARFDDERKLDRVYPEIEKAVNSGLKKYLSEGETAEVVVPRFSLRDPVIFIATQLPSEQGYGLLFLRRTPSGGWEVDQFVPNRAPHNPSRTLKLALDNRWRVFQVRASK